ncbi:MAG: molybdopterin dinucleotide binding domain-containing protein [Candidatus Rokuibacteriota bacterium]
MSILSASRFVGYDPRTARYVAPIQEPVLSGSAICLTPAGAVTCRPAFERYAALCRTYPPARVEQITGVPAAQVVETARPPLGAPPGGLFPLDRARAAHERHSVGPGDLPALRARARLNRSLTPGVVWAQFGWWQACEPLGLSGYDVAGPGSANYNALIDTDVADPISGTIPLHSSLCEVRKASS